MSVTGIGNGRWISREVSVLFGQVGLDVLGPVGRWATAWYLVWPERFRSYQHTCDHRSHGVQMSNGYMGTVEQSTKNSFKGAYSCRVSKRRKAAEKGEEEQPEVFGKQRDHGITQIKRRKVSEGRKDEQCEMTSKF